MAGWSGWCCVEQFICANLSTNRVYVPAQQSALLQTNNPPRYSLSLCCQNDTKKWWTSQEAANTRIRLKKSQFFCWLFDDTLFALPSNHQVWSLYCKVVTVNSTTQKGQLPWEMIELHFDKWRCDKLAVLTWMTQALLLLLADADCFRLREEAHHQCSATRVQILSIQSTAWIQVVENTVT